MAVNKTTMYWHFVHVLAFSARVTILCDWVDSESVGLGESDWHCHQVEDHKNRRHSPISLNRTWDIKLWPDCNFAWYLASMEVSTALAPGHFQSHGIIMPTLSFQSQLVINCMENTIGTDTGDIGSPMQSCRSSQIVEHNLEKVPNYRGKWLARGKLKWSNRKYQKQRWNNHS